MWRSRVSEKLLVKRDLNNVDTVESLLRDGYNSSRDAIDLGIFTNARSNIEGVSFYKTLND